MFGFLTPARRVDAGPLASTAAADKFWQLLPRKDPIAAQGAICEAVLDFATRKRLGREQLRALLLLDERALALREALLVNFTTRNPQLRSLEKRHWRSAVELSQSFASALEHCLGYIRDEPGARPWREYAPTVVLRLFQHRQVEFLLRPLLNAQRVATGWTELHAAYRFAAAQGILQQPVMTARNRLEPSLESTIEREYIHLLLLELMNDGHFSPYDAFWLSRWVPHWCEVVSLQADPPAAVHGEDHFVVDLDSAEGLKRASAAVVGPTFHLDTAPMLALLDAEIESLRDPANPVAVLSSFGRARQMKLLRKVAGNYTPTPKRVDRRGERKRVTSTVKAVIGLANIIRMLRHEEKKKIAATAQVPEVEEITITVTGGYTQAPAGAPGNEDGSGDPPSAHEFGVPHHLWQLKDRSLSGCRLRAPSGDAHRVPPGALVAIRDDETMRWSLVVVRRLKTRIGDRVDIGVEYVGQNPRGVTMTVDDGRSVPAGESPQASRDIFAALYLRESTKHPVMPFKTPIMGARESGNGTPCLTLRSASAEYTVRLKEPIEEQDDFVWLPYEVVDHRATDRPIMDQAADRKVPSRLPVRPQPLAIDSGAPTDWPAPQPVRRFGGAA